MSRQPTVVVCQDCGRPVRTPMSRARRRGAGCERRRRRAYRVVAVPLPGMPARAGQRVQTGPDLLTLLDTLPAGQHDHAAVTIPPRRSAPGPAGRKPTTTRGHRFAPDSAVPADPYTGLWVCATCHCPGRAGDAHHQADGVWSPSALPGLVLPPHVAAAARARDLAILGERDDDDD